MAPSPPEAQYSSRHDMSGLYAEAGSCVEDGLCLGDLCWLGIFLVIYQLYNEIGLEWVLLEMLPF